MLTSIIRETGTRPPVLLDLKNRKEVKMSKTRFVEHARDARTGRYVPMSFAVKHPSITVIERDKIKE